MKIACATILIISGFVGEYFKVGDSWMMSWLGITYFVVLFLMNEKS